MSAVSEGGFCPVLVSVRLHRSSEIKTHLNLASPSPRRGPSLCYTYAPTRLPTQLPAITIAQDYVLTTAVLSSPLTISHDVALTQATVGMAFIAAGSWDGSATGELIGRPIFGSCAVVGSGGGLLGSNHGRLIDTFDNTLRFNTVRKRDDSEPTPVPRPYPLHIPSPPYLIPISSQTSTAPAHVCQTQPLTPITSTVFLLVPFNSIPTHACIRLITHVYRRQ